MGRVTLDVVRGNDIMKLKGGRGSERKAFPGAKRIQVQDIVCIHGPITALRAFSAENFVFLTPPSNCNVDLSRSFFA